MQQQFICHCNEMFPAAEDPETKGDKVVVKYFPNHRFTAKFRPRWHHSARMPTHCCHAGHSCHHCPVLQQTNVSNAPTILT